MTNDQSEAYQITVNNASQRRRTRNGHSQCVPRLASPDRGPVQWVWRELRRPPRQRSAFLFCKCPVDHPLSPFQAFEGKTTLARHRLSG